jgi:Tfp pilus assembly protein PilW
MDHAMMTTKARVSQKGASLIEILIGLAIGLIILIAIGTAYVNANNTIRQREDQAQLNDPARTVMALLRQNLMQAGYVDAFDLDATGQARAASMFTQGDEALANLFIRSPDQPLSTPITLFFPGLTPVFGCDGNMNGSPNGTATAPPPAVQTCGAANPTRHTLQIAYQGAPNSAANPTNSLVAVNANTGDGLDCLQQAPPVGQTLVINRFSLSPLPLAAGTDSQLQCAGSGTGALQDIAPGVEEFVLRYQMSAPGVTPGPLDLAVAAGGGQARYVSAAQVNASPQRWAGVTAVEICMVSATPNTRGPAAQGTTILQPNRPTCTRDAAGVFNADVARVAGDTRLWKRYTAVVSLRNAVFATPL